jgi:hypothetical protein
MALDLEQSSLLIIIGCLILTPSQKTLHIYLKPSVSLESGSVRSGLSMVSKKLGNKDRFSFRVLRVKSSCFFYADNQTSYLSVYPNCTLRLLSILTLLEVVILVLRVCFVLIIGILEFFISIELNCVFALEAISCCAYISLF